MLFTTATDYDILEEARTRQQLYVTTFGHVSKVIERVVAKQLNRRLAAAPVSK